MISNENLDTNRLSNEDFNNIIEKAKNLISGTSSSTDGDNLLHPNRSLLHYRNNRSSENINDSLILSTSPTSPTTTPISPISPTLPILPSSLITSSSSTSSSIKTFIAFPVNKKSRMMIGMIAGIIAVILVGGIVIYDFIKLALGSNEFDLSENN